MRLLDLIREKVRKRQEAVSQAMAYGTDFEGYLTMVGEYRGYQVVLAELKDIAENLEKSSA